MKKEKFETEAKKWRDRFYAGQRIWSVAHHVTVFLPIICSVLAGALLQLKLTDLRFAGLDQTGIATVLTSIAAALTSLSAAGGFDRKWRSNRLSRGRIDRLLLDAESDAPNIPDLTNQLKEVIAKHDEEIVMNAPDKKNEGKSA